MITPKGELNEVFREKRKKGREGGVKSKRERRGERTKGRKTWRAIEKGLGGERVREKRKGVKRGGREMDREHMLGERG